MTAHPYTPAVHPDEDDHPGHEPVDRLACPECGARAVPFWWVWVAGSLLRPRCRGCGTRLVVAKEGALRFAGYAIGTLLGSALILNVREPTFPWWGFVVACGLGFVVDAWCDSRVVRLTRAARVEDPSPRGG